MANVAIFLKSLRPRPKGVAGYRKEILAALKDEGKEMQDILTRATATWTPVPRFRTDVRVAGNDAEMRVSTKDVRFINVDRGTKIRWAVMGRGYVPKSKVRELKAYPGGIINQKNQYGGTAIRGRQAMMARGIRPRPGIKARKFSLETRKIRRPLFYKNMRAAMKRGAKG